VSANYPPVVSVLARQVGLVPLSWFVADDHVEIVFEGGKKYRFALPIAPEAALAAAPSARKPGKIVDTGEPAYAFIPAKKPRKPKK
jgi:hypothetical protein